MKNRDMAILFLILVSCLGVIIGIVFSKKYITDLSSVETAILGIQKTDLSIKETIIKTLLTNIPVFIILLIMGMLVFGFPVSVFLLMYKGYMLGYSCGCICISMGIKGIISAIFGVLLPSGIVLLLLCHLVTLLWSGSYKKNKNTYHMPLKIAFYDLGIMCALSIVQGSIQYFVFYKFI